MTKRPALILATLPAILPAACDKPDPAALEQADRALAGQAVDGQVQPVASRPVMLAARGQGAACRETSVSALTLRWSNSDAGPPKAQASGSVWACQTDGEWTGVIFPGHGQGAGDCGVGAQPRAAREYQGPCRWGWAPTVEVG